ncbi:hypothetical protein DKX38_021961 [Salix brachista]|uniref:Leucine-rich repeat-containing N-terminal plant-type domain-containing protein n=1 Tax=Salix brachista TaxID=2182728 RepID=A0A5N5JZ12_9ROSI|nr:hypothetical protein DKX38_021961 [Salix brachista]
MKCCFRTPGSIDRAWLEGKDRRAGHVSLLDLRFGLTYWHPEIRGLRGTINNSSSLELPHLDLSGDDFLGNPFPNFILDLSSLRYLNLSSNGFIATLSHQLWSLSRLQSLDLRKTTPTLSEPKHLDVGFNSLEGVISEAHFLNLSKLQHLDLSDMVPGFPKWLASQTNLSELDISGARISDTIRGEIPAWIGESLSSLIFLSLYSNEFSGIIQLHLCQLAKIQIFDLSVNNISGTILKFLSNFTSMVKEGELENMIENSYAKQIKRRIPEGTITALLEVIVLNLSRNNLVGVMPEKIGQLQSLDFSENRLSGRIPTSLGDLNFLSHLNLSCNNLSGRIPSSTQLQSFNDSDFTGNPALCGAPNHKKCHLEVYQLMMAAKKMLMNSRNVFILVWESDLLCAFGGSPVL